MITELVFLNYADLLKTLSPHATYASIESYYVGNIKLLIEILCLYVALSCIENLCLYLAMSCVK